MPSLYLYINKSSQSVKPQSPDLFPLCSLHIGREGETYFCEAS
jgi:hypothetical protein